MHELFCRDKENRVFCGCLFNTHSTFGLPLFSFCLFVAKIYLCFSQVGEGRKMLHSSKDEKSHCLGPDVHKIFLWYFFFPPLSSSPSTAAESRSLFPWCSAVCHLEFSLRFQSIWLWVKGLLRQTFPFPYFRHFACRLIAQVGLSTRYVCFW